MAIPLEDTAADIIGKAQRGLGISDSQLAEKARRGCGESARSCATEKLDETAIRARRPRAWP